METSERALSSEELDLNPEDSTAFGVGRTGLCAAGNTK